MLKIGVLASGGGTNLQAIIDAVEAGRIPAEVAVVISDKPGSGALKRAKTHNIRVVVVEKRDFTHREDFDRALVSALEEAEVGLVVLAGFMRLLTPVFIRAFPQKIINIHPALLPSFPGLDVQAKALEHGVKFSGCTVHFVDEGVDTGPIIIQAVVPVLDSDTPETLASRILAEEHRIYPEAIALFANGRLSVDGRRVLVDDTDGDGCNPDSALENPPVKVFGPAD